MTELGLSVGPKEELLPCPFCKATNMVIDSDDLESWFVWCINCDATGPRTDHREEAARDWNKAHSLKGERG